MEFTEIQHLSHLVGLSILIILYLLRLTVLMRRRWVPDRAPDPKGDIARGVIDALLTIVMPWKMESTRKHWSRYAEFVVFHIAVFTTILVSFAITYLAQLMVGTVRNVLITLIALGLLVGTIRFVRRTVAPEMQVISSFDDYISLFLVLVFKATAILTLLGLYWASLVYFGTAFILLVYEPFSKIRHYIYYPFTRFFYGAEFTRKGVFSKGVRGG